MFAEISTATPDFKNHMVPGPLSSAKSIVDIQDNMSARYRHVISEIQYEGLLD